MINKYNVQTYCSDFENIENYQEAINSQAIYECHHRLEHELNVTRQDLIDWGLYFNRPADELVFLTRSQHRALHMTMSNIQTLSSRMSGHKHTDETKWTISNRLTEYWKNKDEELYPGHSKVPKKIIGQRNNNISMTMRSMKSVYVEFDDETPWGKYLTTRQIAELNGNTHSGKVKQTINKYGYINIRHIRYYCHIAD